MAWEPTTDDDDDRRRDSQIIPALLQRLPIRPARDQTRSRANTPGGHDGYEATIRQHGTDQHQDPERPDNGRHQMSTTESTTQPTRDMHNARTSTGVNRYALLNPDVTCDDIPGTTTTNAWTIVTRERKRNADPRRQRRDEHDSTRDNQTGVRHEKGQGCLQRADTDARPCEQNSQQSQEQSRLRATEVEAHVGEPTRGDAHPPPNPGVTPLTKHLDEQSDVLGAAHVRSPRMLQLFRRIREVTAEPLQVKKVHPLTSTTTATTTADLTLIRSDHDLDHKSIIRDPTAAQYAREWERPRRTMDPVHRAKHYCQTLGPLTDEERHDVISRYLMEGQWINNDNDEDVLVKPTTYRTSTGPETGTGEPIPLRQEAAEEPHDAISVRRNELKKNLLVDTRRTAEDDGSRSSEESANNRSKATTPSKDTVDQTTVAKDSNCKGPTERQLAPGEDNPIAAINALTDGEQEGLREILSIDDTPLTKTDLGKILRQIKSCRDHDSPETLEEETNPVGTTTLVRAPGPVQPPNAQTDKVLAPGNTLDDEELWDAFTRDDREEMLSQLLGDDDADGNPTRRSNTRYEFAYVPCKPEDPDSGEDEQDDTGPLRNDKRNEYGVSLQHGYLDDPAISGSDRGALSDLGNRLTGWTYRRERSEDEEGDKPSSESNDDNSASGFGGEERNHAQPLKDGERNKYKIVLQRDPDVYPRHEDDKFFHDEDDGHPPGDSDDEEAQHDILPFIDEGQYDVQPSIDEGHDEGDSREEIELELHGLGRAYYLTTTPATVPPFPEHDLEMILSSKRSDLTSSDSEARLPSSNDFTTSDEKRGKHPDMESAPTLAEKKPDVDGFARGNAIPPPSPVLLAAAWTLHGKSKDEQQCRADHELGSTTGGEEDAQFASPIEFHEYINLRAQTCHKHRTLDERMSKATAPSILTDPSREMTRTTTGTDERDKITTSPGTTTKGRVVDEEFDILAEDRAKQTDHQSDRRFLLDTKTISAPAIRTTMHDSNKWDHSPGDTDSVIVQRLHPDNTHMTMVDSPAIYIVVREHQVQVALTRGQRRALSPMSGPAPRRATIRGVPPNTHRLRISDRQPRPSSDTKVIP
ncbi:hypothetical protein EDB86DRAFT_3110567 [Lactarius hatsudake]|nr:hypothetical protein EDB86DRAFT_3110567 [Lactarius hatsudake]